MIKYIVLDVDGTLTDGKIYMGANGEIMKAFDIKDGYGIHDILPSIGIKPLLITGRQSKIVENRCKELGIVDCYQGINNKLNILEEFLNVNNGKLSEVAYIGDDINDLPSMKAIINAGGIIGCPNNAIVGVKEISSFISQNKGGDGAVREFIDFLANINVSAQKNT